MTSRAVKQAKERRSGRDRRGKDKGPPTGRDRRVGMEPRRPEVTEVEFSPSEWERMEAAFKAESDQDDKGDKH